MTSHDHREHVDGCYRCDLGKDEAIAAAGDEVREALAPFALGDRLTIIALASYDLEEPAQNDRGAS